MKGKEDALTVWVSPQRLLRALVSCVVILLVLHLIGQTAKFVFGYDSLKGFVPMFDMDTENMIPAVFSGFLLASCALVLFHISESVQRVGGPQSFFARHWKGLAVIFLLLSLDELCELHEKLILPVRQLLHASGIFHYAWIIPGMIFVFALLAVYARFLGHLEPAVRNRFLLSGVIFVGGAVGMEMVGGWWSEQHSQANLTFALMVAVEESMEMMGAVLFLTSLVRHAIGLQSSAAFATDIALTETGVGAVEHGALRNTEDAPSWFATT